MINTSSVQPSTAPSSLSKTIARLLLLFICCFNNPVSAQTLECLEGQHIQHTFSSGAAWQACASVHAENGLRLNSLLYKAPGGSYRSVLFSAEFSQILIHYHDNPIAEPQLGPVADEITDTHQSEILIFTENNCESNTMTVSDLDGSVCERINNNRTLAKYAQRPSLHSESWEIYSGLQRGSLIWLTSFVLTEDGTIRPSLYLSGRASESDQNPVHAEQIVQLDKSFTRAHVYATWRMVFDLDANTQDTVEQYDFTLNTELGNRRLMQITPITTETLRQVNQDTFRGWRVLDENGAGYYLDPSNSGFRYTSRDLNWAQFDVAFTRYYPCERYALNNPDRPACGSSLDDFVSGESLNGEKPVLWYSQSRHLSIRPEDWPIISHYRLSFDLLPFDWTPLSPFEVVD